MSELADLSETDASNTSITAISIAEGCPPGNINNAIRAALGLLKRAFNTTNFRLRDSSDQTKLLAFGLSGITTATTRTITVPDADITLPIVTPWVAYTPTFVGVGTLADLKCRSRRVGSNLEVQAQWTNGTVTASDFSLTMGFNGVNGTITCATFWNTYRPLCGTAVWNINDAALYMIASGGSNLVNISISASGRQGLTPVVGTTLGTSTTIGAQFSVPIEGWN